MFKPKNSLIGKFLALLVILGMGIASFYIVQHPEMFKADILSQSGTPGNIHNILYIPDNYSAVSPTSTSTIAIKAGDIDMGTEYIAGVRATFLYDPTQIQFDPTDAIDWSVSSHFSPVATACAPLGSITQSNTPVDQHSARFLIDFLCTKSYKFAPKSTQTDETVFGLKITVASSLSTGANINIAASGERITIAPGGNLLRSRTSTTITSIAAGRITVALPICTEAHFQCPAFTGVCPASGVETRTCTKTVQDLEGIVCRNAAAVNLVTSHDCVCNANFDTVNDWTCGDWSMCVNGKKSRTCTPKNCKYNGSTNAVTQSNVDCEVANVEDNKLGLILALDEASVRKLNAEQRKEAFSSAAVIINSTAAAGKVIKVEGSDVTLSGATIDGLASNLAAQINALTIAGKKPISAAGNAMLPGASVNLPGVVYLTPTSQDDDGVVSIDPTSQTGDITIVPMMGGGLTLKRTDGVFGMQVIAKLNDGTSSLYNQRQITWVGEPVNRLSSEALNAGRLEVGDRSGTVHVFVEAKKVGGTPEEPTEIAIRSNTLSVNIPSEPSIDYARILGAGSITRGDQITLSVKVSDFETIADIQDISTSIVRSAFNTYTEINADTNAKWFTRDAYVEVSEVETTESGTDPITDSGADTATDTTTDTETASDTSDKNYRIYEIPVKIPQDSNMQDGPYKLLISITDKLGHESVAVLPITIGAVASGDVNGDTYLTMTDVLWAYGIYNGSITNPTPAMLTAANMDGKGGVTMYDVVLLFNKVNKK